MLKRTPLYEAHQRLGGRLIEFGGWEMPVQYTGIIDEHLTVREAAGMFDISHMGEVLVSGPAAVDFLNRVLTNDIRKLEIGGAQYTLMCNGAGGVVDDLYTYRFGEKNYLLIINASRIGEDVSWLLKQFEEQPNKEGTHVLDVSEKYGAIAVQGPKVTEFIDACFDGEIIGGFAGVSKPSALGKNQALNLNWHGNSLWISRTGYTGEDGFEVICTEGVVEAVWNRVLEIGQPFGLLPSGLGARDTLRIEAGLPLYGHELDEKTTPIEAGVGFFVDLEKSDFLGKPVLSEQKQKGVLKKCVAFKMTEKSAPPRSHYPIWTAEEAPEKIGEVTSGTQSPSLGVGIGLGYVPVARAKAGTPVTIEIRGRRVPAEVVKKPIYRKAG